RRQAIPNKLAETVAPSGRKETTNPCRKVVRPGPARRRGSTLPWLPRNPTRSEDTIACSCVSRFRIVTRRTPQLSSRLTREGRQACRTATRVAGLLGRLVRRCSHYLTFGFLKCGSLLP